MNDLRQVVTELVLTLVDNKVEPTHALTQSLDRVNMPFEELVQERRSVSYSWATLETTTSSEDVAQTDSTSTDQGEDTEKEAPSTTNQRPQRRTKRRSRTRATPQNSDVTESD